MSVPVLRSIRAGDRSPTGSLQGSRFLRQDTGTSKGANDQPASMAPVPKATDGYADPRDEYIRSPKPVPLRHLERKWHAKGKRDGSSLSTLRRLRREEKWDRLRAAYHGEHKTHNDGNCARDLWQGRVQPHLPAILDCLVGQAMEGNLPAIKLILEAEGLASKGSMTPEDDQYPEIVAECCEPLTAADGKSGPSLTP